MTKLVSFKLDESDDEDLIRWLDSRENRSLSIREVLREHVRGNGVKLSDIYSKLCDLERRIKSGVVVSESKGADNEEYTEPPDVAQALDALANL